MLKVLKNKILIKQDKMPEKINGLYIPTSNETHSPPYSGTIICVGDKVKDTDFVTGSKILYGDLSGTEVWVNDEKYLIVSEQDIVAVVENLNLEIM
jgi:chaperonin GroES